MGQSALHVLQEFGRDVVDVGIYRYLCYALTKPFEACAKKLQKRIKIERSLVNLVNVSVSFHVGFA